MNLDTSTWPELLSGWGFIEMAITWLLIIAIFCVISIGAGFITRLTSINILGPSLAQTHPDIVQALDWWIAVMRTVAYMLVVINISAFISGRHGDAAYRPSASSHWWWVAVTPTFRP